MKVSRQLSRICRGIAQETDGYGRTMAERVRAMSKIVDTSASVATLKANVQGYNCNYNVEYALIHGHATLLSSLSSRGAKSKFGLARDAVGVDELEVNVVLFGFFQMFWQRKNAQERRVQTDGI